MKRIFKRSRDAAGAAGVRAVHNRKSKRQLTLPSAFSVLSEEFKGPIYTPDFAAFLYSDLRLFLPAE